MDAQNAAPPDRSKPGAASPSRRRGSIVDDKPATSGAASLSKETSSKREPAKSDDERDSDAETVVLPGKDGHSPSKVRKVRQEDKNDSDDGPSKDTRRGKDDKKKRATDKDSGSSGQSSNPASPELSHRRLQHRRRRSEVRADSDSDSNHSPRKALAKSAREASRTGDRSISLKRKTPKMESDDEIDGRKARRQRTTSASVEPSRTSRESRMRSHGRGNSNSPPPRMHRRSISTQLQSGTAFAQRRRRNNNDYDSDSSSGSDSPRPRNSKLRSLATPSNNESHASPAKVGVHKKHLDAHGQTLLARACARGEYDGAKQRLKERPEDLNVADYAGNTPLQIAAINGCEDIVKLLIDAGCNLDCVNFDKETPLLDAVDNGHLGVVKLLLAAGVNPRKANVNGEEPIDRVTEETENGEEIRAALIAAKKNVGDKRPTSEDHHSNNEKDSHGADSPRNSPAATLANSRRGTNVRSTKTRNDLLYMPLDDKTLRQAAGRGDEETVARILQVKEGFDDPESMVAAARGGHDLVIQLLLGLGGANADPAPVSGLAPEFATPMLAAIGQENINVVKLLLEQQGFDPTRRFKGETYYEIARRRQGTNWKDEEHLLKNSYDDYKRNPKDARSPGRREKDRAREEKRARREDGKKSAALVGKHRSDSFSSESKKRDVSDRDVKKSSKSKRTDEDSLFSSDGESNKPRRKLVSKGELRGDRKRDGKRDESPERPKKPKASKRDDKDSDAPTKRHRSTTTPDKVSDAENEESEVPVKRRRLEGEDKDKRSKRSEEGSQKKSRKGGDGNDSDNSRSKKDSGVTVKSEDADVDMADANAMSDIPRKTSEKDHADAKDSDDEFKKESRKQREQEDSAKRKRKAEEEAKQREEEKARKAKEAEEAAQREEALKKRKAEEAERKQREDEERQRREKEERAAAEEAKRLQEEEERKERERRERAHREELERKRAAREAEARRLREEQERAKLDKLPPLLRWLHMYPNPKSAAVAEMFKSMLGVRYDTIRQEANGTNEGREQWVLNTHVALLLGEKDLDLARYTAWERVPVSRLGKLTIWRTEWPRYSLLSEKLWDLGRQLPGYYGDDDPSTLNFRAKETLKKAAWDRFLATELFFVKLSDLLYTIPNIPHLRTIKLAVEYRELLESDAQASGWQAGQKWKQDPGADRFFGFAPRNKYYVNGAFVGEDAPTKHLTSKTPFPEQRVPRRGLVPVFPGDPDYESICVEQGLTHLLADRSPTVPNGIHVTALPQGLVNGTNGHGQSSNGINGSSN